MALLAYKCPNCGGGLTFDPDSQKFRCEFCLSEFTEQEMKRLEEEAEKKARETEELFGSRKEGTGEDAGPEIPGAGEALGRETPDGGEEAGLDGRETPGSGEEPGQDGQESPEGGENGDAAVYTCPGCGAQIVTDATTAATFCYYCHSPVVLSGRLSGQYLPDFVLPFAFDKKEAKTRFLSWIRKKKFVPAEFSSSAQVEKLSGIYFPYLVYSCRVEGSAEAEGEQSRTWVSGRTRYTEHKKYQVERAGTLEVKNLTRNALSKSNRELVEGVLPFEMDKLLPFQMGYLSGFQAEKRDMGKDAFANEAEGEVRDYTLQMLKSSMGSYENLRVKDSSMEIRDPRWQYALLPVWVLTYGSRAGGKKYYFAMNGQTGKIWGRLPVDKRKLAGLFFSVFLPAFAALMIGGWFL